MEFSPPISQLKNQFLGPICTVIVFYGLQLLNDSSFRLRLKLFILKHIFGFEVAA